MVSPSPFSDDSSFGKGTEVQDKLARERRRRRAPGDTAYPLAYSRDLADFDVWEHMFLTKLCRGLTMHEFASPPKHVLDLGCGGGIWVLEASSQWTDTTFVGLDIKDIQPDIEVLSSFIPEYAGLKKRVKWVHSNFLDRLHFTSEHFDFVRICCIGLGVPEDEWPDVLEEVHRVLKPGGVLEIIEEDLIFPAAKTNRPPAEPFQPTPTRSSTSEHGTAPRRSDALLSRYTPYGSVSEGRSQPPSQRTSKVSLATKGSVNSLIVPSAPDVRDHSRLKEAWASVIDQRFLAVQLSMPLTLFLSSTFKEYQQRPTVQVPLPPNSRMEGELDPNPVAASQPDDRAPHEHARVASSIILPGKAHIAGFNDAMLQASREWVAKSAQMHLARAVATISHCKDALRAEYERLYAHLPCYGDNTVAEDFEMYWEHWRNDMTDRIGMRATVLSQMQWAEPPDDPDRGPNWRKWREAAAAQDPPPLPVPSASISGRPNGTLAVPTGAGTVSSPEFCRSLRGFVAFKAPKPSS